MRRICICILLISFYIPFQSQDFLFSQYFASQPYLNPAMTGFFDGSYRINAQVRNQWQGIGSGINTYGVNADYKFGENDPEDDYFAIGICAYRDEIFKRVYYHTARVNGSFTKRLGYGATAHYLSIGGNFGMDYKMVSTNYLGPDDNPNGPPSVVPAVPNKAIGNMGLGLNYQIIFPSFANIFFGVSADHLASTDASVFNSNLPTDKRIIVYSSARLKVVNDKLFILPTFLLANQASHRQINFGVSAQILTRNYFVSKANFQIGLFTRMGSQSLDAIIPVFRYENRGIQIGISYDHNLSELSSATGGYGGLELSLGYIGFIERIVKSRAECPDMKNF